MKIILATVAAAVLLSACSSTPLDTPASSNTSAPAPVVDATQPTAKAVTTPQALAAHLDPNSVISQKRSIYFDYDKFNVKSEYNAVVEAHAAYLKSHPELSVRLEGHADERGGREYNLALGQKRSEAVQRALSTLGAGAKQQEAVSFGKEKPKATGHDEAAWAQNRRVDIVYQTK